MKRTSNEQLYLKKLGAQIKTIRKQHRIKQIDLAHKTQLDRSYLSDIERGQCNISVILLNRIAQALQISLSELITNL